MRRLALAALGLGVIVASCASNEVADTQPSVIPDSFLVTTTTAAPTTTAPPETTSSLEPSTTTTTIPLSDVALTLEVIDNGFDNPVLVVPDPEGGPEFVVEQPGSIVRADGAGHERVLDLTREVVFGGEQGLLGLAFHPQYASNHLAYVAWVAPGPRSIIEQFRVVNGVFDMTSRVVILEMKQPARNHNGGMIAFGPDGYLWIGMGDGGAANDRFRNGQNPDTLLGAMLRISVGTEGPDRYGIPPDNPYADGRDGAPEIWAVGLRNPWRFSFDGDDVWIADVGQDRIEEVNVVSSATPGLNFGWSIMEGSSCFRSSCDTEGLTLPVAEYSHGQGCSIIGGVVYRGDLIPSLRGQFLYADYCSGRLWSVSRDGDVVEWTDRTGRIDRPTGFGTGADGEVYIVNQRGTLLKVATKGG